MAQVEAACPSESVLKQTSTRKQMLYKHATWEKYHIQTGWLSYLEAFRMRRA